MMEEWGIADETPSHGILVQPCNFNCKFCNRTFLDKNCYADFSDDEFALSVLNLLPDGNRFKFSGGEPTLDRTLEQKLSFIRQCGGKTFLDTNGSFPERILSLLEKNLVDVLGVSLKGISPEEACETSGLDSVVSCWQNPLETIRLATRFSNVRFTATYVFYGDDSERELEAFSAIVPCLENMRLKMNNLYYDRHRVAGLKRLTPLFFRNLALHFLEKHPEWRGKMILVENEQAISTFDAIKFL